jgi:hypothetical protein
MAPDKRDDGGPYLPVLVQAGRFKSAKEWAQRVGLRPTDFRWLGDTRAAEGVGGDRWWVDLGTCGVEGPARVRYHEVVDVLDMRQRQSVLELHRWEENA